MTEAPQETADPAPQKEDVPNITVPTSPLRRRSASINSPPASPLPNTLERVKDTPPRGGEGLSKVRMPSPMKG